MAAGQIISVANTDCQKCKGTGWWRTPEDDLDICDCVVLL